MEGEPTNSSQIIAKKMWSILKIVMMMIKKGISKGKLITDLNMLLKWANQLAGKAVNGLIIHHNSILCRPNDPNSYFINPKDYEFSCSNSPVVGPIHTYLMMAQHKIRPKLKPKSTNQGHNNYHLEDPTTVAAVQRVLEMMNTTEASPASPLCGEMEMGTRGQYMLSRFGSRKSPCVKQLRITDSPYPLKDGKGSVEEEEEDVKVNKAADEFIKKFYKNLRMQKFLESP